MDINKKDLEILLELDKFEKITTEKIEETLKVSNRLAYVYKVVIENKNLFSEMFPNSEILTENRVLARQKQKYMDSNRIERKAFREQIRMENALISLNKAVLEKFEKINFNIPVVEHNSILCSNDKAIIQLSDTHFNELVDLDSNRYDFEIASKRLSLYASEVKRILASYGIKKVVLAMTGDMINSDRRLDEKLNMSTNRMSATMLATNLIQYFIQDLMQQFEEMDIVYVTGNESRVDEFGFTDMVVTDNYDSIIFNMLNLIFRENRNITFIKSNPVETIITVNNKNILLMHGTTLKASATQTDIQKNIGRYANNGVKVDYVLFGHIHFCNIGDIFARSGSLVGSNSYSTFALGLTSKPSQNLHIIREDGTINNIRVELQNIDDIKGYPIQNDLDAYNAKSATKTNERYKTIDIKNIIE